MYFVSAQHAYYCRVFEMFKLKNMKSIFKSCNSLPIAAKGEVQPIPSVNILVTKQILATV